MNELSQDEMEEHQYWDWFEDAMVHTNVVCPWCGYEETDTWDFYAVDDGSCETFICNNCGKKIEITGRSIGFEFVVRREEEEPVPCPTN